MSISPRHSSRSAHTVVLRSRGVAASQPLVIGSKQRHFSCARGSPPRHPPPVACGPTGPLPCASIERVQQQQTTYAREGDLLVSFGIDSTMGRVVAYVLVWLILFQPMYVALGMEIEDPVVTEAQATEDLVEDIEEGLAENAQVMEDVEEEENSHEEIQDSTTESDVIDLTDDTNNDEDDDTFDVDNDVDNDVEGAAAATSDTEMSGNDMVEDEVVDNETEETEQVAEGTDIDESQDDAAAEDDITDEENNDDVANDVDTDIVDDTTGDGSSSDDTNDEDDGTGTAETDEESAGGEDDTVDTEDADEETGDAAGDESDKVSAEEGDHSSDSSGDESGSTEENDTKETGEASNEETASSTDELLDDAIDEDASGEVVTIAQNAENRYMFGEGDCTLVADGEFYCVAADAERLVTGDPRVYAEKDREGDREIFYFDGVQIQRITNNSYDDFAPVFDEETMRIVWQAMLNDRLQVMMHEIPTNTTRQITTTRQNSSNPDIVEGTVVWQEWVDTNWEIMITDVDNDGAEFDIEQLTDNAVHDMFPQAYDDLITWQSERGSSWEVVVYDLRTGKRHMLQKNEDTMYENPRFVLLFDSKHENGDVETIGYDLDTGEMMELGTKAKPIPADPLTPKDETPDALPREAASSTQVKVGREDDGNDDDLVL